MMTAVAMFEEKAYDCQGFDRIAQAQRIDVMLQNAVIPVFRFAEWMNPVLFPEAVSVEIVVSPDHFLRDIVPV